MGMEWEHTSSGLVAGEVGHGGAEHAGGLETARLLGWLEAGDLGGSRGSCRRRLLARRYHPMLCCVALIDDRMGWDGEGMGELSSCVGAGAGARSYHCAEPDEQLGWFVALLRSH